MASVDTRTNLAAIVYNKLDVRLESVPIPEPGEHGMICRGQYTSVQILVKMVGICGTDIHLWQEGCFTDAYKLPMVLGHECSGVVSKIGTEVTRHKVGDRVCVEPVRPCRNCEFCHMGRCNVCPNTIYFFSDPPHNGAMTRYLIQDEIFVYKLPDHVSFEEGALMEPLSVVLRACSRARVTAGDNILISGAGTIGLLVLMVAKAYGANSVIVTDVNESRLGLAKQMGASHVLQIQRDESPEDVSNRVKTLLGFHPDKALECCGKEFSANVCILVTKPCGVVGLIGLGSPYMTIPLQRVTEKEIDLIGSVCYVKTFPAAIEMIASKRINTLPLISHRYQLNEILEALETTRSGTGLKTIVECNPN